jgi:hypothetical protein
MYEGRDQTERARIDSCRDFGTHFKISLGHLLQRKDTETEAKVSLGPKSVRLGSRRGNSHF